MSGQTQIEFSYSMIKGRIAESIVTELFRLSNYEVYPFGIEHIAPGIINGGRNACGEMERLLRRSPDLLVRDPDNNCFLIEVKYRKFSKSSFSVTEFLTDYPYPECYVFLLGEDKLLCATVAEIQQYKYEAFVVLANKSEFKFRQGMIRQAIEWTTEFLP